MGCFDSVMIPCPMCKHDSEFQSKGGDCIQSYYTLENAPDNVLSDIDRHSPNTCFNCGTVFGVNVTRFVYVKVVIVDVAKGSSNDIE